jgi:hypothetical protein
MISSVEAEVARVLKAGVVGDVISTGIVRGAGGVEAPRGSIATPGFRFIEVPSSGMFGDGSRVHMASAGQELVHFGVAGNHDYVARTCASTSTASGGHVGHKKSFWPDLPPTTSGPLTLVAGQCYAVYIGDSPSTLSSLDAIVSIHGIVAAGAGWAEVGIATGAFEKLSGVASTDLTILGAQSVDAEAKTPVSALVAKTISGLSISAGIGLWAIVACSYATTQMSCRYSPYAENGGWGGFRIRAATRPSTNLNTPLAFTTDGGNVPTVGIQIIA